jgi:hypothetical protein
MIVKLNGSERSNVPEYGGSFSAPPIFVIENVKKLSGFLTVRNNAQNALIIGNESVSTWLSQIKTVGIIYN